MCRTGEETLEFDKEVNMSEKREQYLELARSGISPEDFYRRIRSEGVSKFDAFTYLRDGYDMDLAQCMEVSSKAEKQSS
jgi:hypothetical protein